MMQLKPITTEEYKESWDIFLTAQPYSQFLQSWQWGEFIKSQGKDIYRYLLEDNGKIAGVCFFYKESLPLGFKYFYCPRGPIFSNYTLNALIQFISEIKKVAQKEKIDFIKIEPALKTDEYLTKELKNIGFQKSKKEIQPAETLMIDISKTEEELLRQMHEKTRYNIRLSQKKDIKIELVKNEGLENFYSLMQKTAQRDSIKIHPKNYYHKLIENTDAQIIQAVYQGKIIASNIIYFFGDTAYYLHGASDYEFRPLMAPFLLQWQTILEAKNRRCSLYDFWGASLKKPGWAGITRFKQGFCPNYELTEFVGPWDLPVSKFRYSLYSILRKIRKIIKLVND